MEKTITSNIIQRYIKIFKNNKDNDPSYLLDHFIELDTLWMEMTEYEKSYIVNLLKKSWLF